MTPLPENPTVVIKYNPETCEVEAVASNVSDDLKVIVTQTPSVFTEEAANKPFDTTRPPHPQQTLSSKASKARYASPLVK